MGKKMLAQNTLLYSSSIRSKTGTRCTLISSDRSEMLDIVARCVSKLSSRLKWWIVDPCGTPGTTVSNVLLIMTTIYQTRGWCHRWMRHAWSRLTFIRLLKQQYTIGVGRRESELYISPRQWKIKMMNMCYSFSDVLWKQCCPNIALRNKSKVMVWFYERAVRGKNYIWIVSPSVNHCGGFLSLKFRWEIISCL